MKHFSIHDLEHFSGVKSHTLRIWERRYNFLLPERSAGGTRLYNVNELKQVLNFALLSKNGFRVSQLSEMSEAMLEQKITQLPDPEDHCKKDMNSLLLVLYGEQPESFENILDELSATWTLPRLLQDIIYPFLSITGLLWSGNRLYGEHFAVTATRKKLILGIESINCGLTTKQTALLFLQGTRQLDLGLLYSYYLLKTNDCQVLYLGNDVTIHNLEQAVKMRPPAFLFTYLPQSHEPDAAHLSDLMYSHAPASKLLVGTYANNSSDAVQEGNLVHMRYTDALQYMILTMQGADNL